MKLPGSSTEFSTRVGVNRNKAATRLPHWEFSTRVGVNRGDWNPGDDRRRILHARGGEPSWETRKRGQADGGAGDQPTYQIGITSDRPEAAFQKKHLREFVDMLAATPVKNLMVRLGRGGWKGGWEPSFVTQYNGNGEAIKALAKFGKKYNQEAVLVQRSTTRDDPAAQPQVRLGFGSKLTTGQRENVESLLDSQGIGGWTWATSGGRHTLVLTNIPQYGGEPSAHLRACARVKLALETRKQYGAIKGDVRHVVVTMMKGDNYDDYISGKLTATTYGRRRSQWQ